MMEAHVVIGYDMLVPLPFLKESLFRPVFHDLWAIRHEM